MIDKTQVAIGNHIVITCGDTKAEAVATEDTRGVQGGCDKCVLANLPAICENYACDGCTRIDGKDIIFIAVKI